MMQQMNLCQLGTFSFLHVHGFNKFVVEWKAFYGNLHFLNWEQFHS